MTGSELAHKLNSGELYEQYVVYHLDSFPLEDALSELDDAVLLNLEFVIFLEIESRGKSDIVRVPISTEAMRRIDEVCGTVRAAVLARGLETTKSNE